MEVLIFDAPTLFPHSENLFVLLFLVGGGKSGKEKKKGRLKSKGREKVNDSCWVNTKNRPSVMGQIQIISLKSLENVCVFHFFLYILLI